MFTLEVMKSLTAVDGRYIAWEEAFPRGRLKRDLITLRESDGRESICFDEKGRALHVDVPPEMLNDFIRWKFVRADGRDREGRLVFRATDDGR